MTDENVSPRTKAGRLFLRAGMLEGVPLGIWRVENGNPATVAGSIRAIEDEAADLLARHNGHDPGFFDETCDACIEREASSPALDVERLARAIRPVKWLHNDRDIARTIAAEYARLAARDRFGEPER